MPKIYFRQFLLIWVVALLPFARGAWAFPEFVRHNYVNCNSCHVSPTGGGVLTQYGRQLSGEVLSSWSNEATNESKFAWGVVPQPTWLDTMGVYRGIYAYQNTPYIQQGQYIYMEGDIEAAAHYQKWYLDVTAGYQNPPTAQAFSDHLLSRRHFVGFTPTEETSFRVGRFFPAYGINTPVHTRYIKQDLGWNEAANLESYNLEAAWIGPVYNLFATADFGRPDDPAQHHETGASLTASAAFADHFKIGASYFYGNGPGSTRNLFGPWGILGFASNFYLLTEWDFQQQSDKNGVLPAQWGAINFNQLGYEVVKGLHLYGVEEYSRLSFSDQTSLHHALGGGLSWYPRSHFEVNLEWKKLKSAQIGESYTDLAWLMLNIYI